MKTLSTLICLSVLIGSSVSAQSTPVGEKKKEQTKTAVVVERDENANGIEDAKEKQQTGKTSTSRMRDHFIDANGDGICDNREQGLGFRRKQMGTRKQTGKYQQGRHK